MFFACGWEEMVNIDLRDSEVVLACRCARGNVHLAPQRSCSLNGGEKVFHRWGTFCRRVHILMQLFSNANRRDWWSGVDRLHSQAKAKASGTLDAYGKSGEASPVCQTMCIPFLCVQNSEDKLHTVMEILNVTPPEKQCHIDTQMLLEQLSQAGGNLDQPSGSIDTQLLLAQLSQLEKQKIQKSRPRHLRQRQGRVRGDNSP